MLQGQPFHPLKHALQLFTDASKEGWGAHLNDHTTRGMWSLPESNLHIYYLLCALLWRILTWCTSKQVTLRVRHIPGWLNVVADQLSILGQTIQTEWSLHPEVFQAICRTTHAGESFCSPRGGPTTCPICSHNHSIRLYTGICQT